MKTALIYVISITLLFSAENPGLSVFDANNNNALVALGGVAERFVMYVTLNGDGKIINILHSDQKPEEARYKDVSLRDIDASGTWDLRISCIRLDNSYEYEIYVDSKWVRVDRLDADGNIAIVGKDQYEFINGRYASAQQAD